MLCNIGLCCSGMLCTFNKGIIDINLNSLMRICLIGLIARQLIVIEGLKGKPGQLKGHKDISEYKAVA